MKTLVICLSICLAVAAWAAGSGSAGAASADCTSPVVTRNVPYVEDQIASRQELDVYGLESDGCDPVPVVVYVHGGGWRAGDKRAVGDKATFFNDLGYVFVSVNYRLSDPPGDPDRPIHPAHADDVGAAVAWVEDTIDQHGGDGKHIALIGHSAGGHLVSLVGVDPQYVEQAGGAAGAVRCVISNDTEGYDLVERVSQGGSSQQLVANAFGADESVYADASPINHVSDRDEPPDFLVITRGLPRRVAAAQAFADAVADAGASVDVLRPFGLTHGDVNRLIGAAGDTVMTPPIEKFTRACLS